jgi:cytochrome c oxidase assembly factor CtaG
MAQMSPPSTWTFEPSVLVPLAALTSVYMYAWLRARRPGQPHPPGYGRLALFAGGVLAVVIALESPVDAASDDLMVVHMGQHILLLDIAPILLILGLTKGILRPVTRRVTAIERRAGWFASPVFAVIAYCGFMWLWHIPAAYDLALRHSAVHYLEHVCFALAGGLYWWHLVSPIRARARLGGMGPVAYMVSTKFIVGLLGVILAFAPVCFYPWYRAQPHWWGISPVEDQNLAGVVMALEQSIVMGIALVYLFVRMLTESEREAQRKERSLGIVS